MFLGSGQSRWNSCLLVLKLGLGQSGCISPDSNLSRVSSTMETLVLASHRCCSGCPSTGRVLDLCWTRTDASAERVYVLVLLQGALFAAPADGSGVQKHQTGTDGTHWNAGRPTGWFYFVGVEWFFHWKMCIIYNLSFYPPFAFYSIRSCCVRTGSWVRRPSSWTSSFSARCWRPSGWRRRYMKTCRSKWWR